MVSEWYPSRTGSASENVRVVPERAVVVPERRKVVPLGVNHEDMKHKEGRRAEGARVDAGGKEAAAPMVVPPVR